MRATQDSEDDVKALLKADLKRRVITYAQLVGKLTRGYRCAVVASVGWLTLTANAHDGPLPKQTAERYQRDTSNQMSRATKAVVTAINPAKEAPAPDRGCEKDRDDRHSDLCAQWKAADAAEESADWAARAFWLGGLGTALLLWTLLYTARGTRAATDAVETQINADRPLMQISKVTYTNFDPFHATFDWGYEVKNLGGTPCWTEAISIGVGVQVEDLPSPEPLHAFVPPGTGGLTTIGLGRTLRFREDEMASFVENEQLFCFGAITYRNAAGIRWESGFAVRTIIENGAYKAFSPVPDEKHWFDRKLPPAKRQRWYQRKK